MDLAKAAVDYVKQGLSVLAIKPRGKEPIAAWKEFQSRRADEQEVRGLFDRFPDANVGTVTGQISGTVVIDIDSEEAKDKLKEQASEYDLENVPRTRTGKGWQLFFKHPGGKIPNRAGILPGLDVRGDGGFVVLPPSIHPNGRVYRWEVPLNGELPKLPQQLFSLITSGNGTEQGHRERFDTSRALAGVPEGERDETLFKLASKLRSADIPQDMAQALLLEAARNCKPPFPEAIAIEKVGRAYTKYEPKQFTPGQQAEHLTDLGNAQRLARLHGEDLRYCHQLGWLVWDGQRWKRSEQGEIEQRAKHTVRSIYTEAANCADEEVRKALATHAKRSESEARIKAMISLAQSEPGIPIKIDKLDRNPWLLNVENGTLDLKGGGLREHRREDLITLLVTSAYNPKAECPTWDEFQKRITDGDADLIKFKQKRLGYSLTGDISERCIFIDYGPGSNGKTTEQRTAQRLLGEYARQCPIETFLASKGDKIPNDIARLRGARLVIAAETEMGRRLAESLVKQVTGGDRVVARFLNREYFEFTPEFKLWMAVNHKPNIRGTDNAIWNRLRLVPFAVTIPEEEQDPGLTNRLAEELPGILRWALDGLAMWHSERLGKPRAIREATERYRNEMDVLGAFLADCCEINPDGEVATGGLYQSYCMWCEDNGEKPVSQKDFGMALTERGFHGGRQGKERTRTWQGLTLLGGHKG